MHSLRLYGCKQDLKLTRQQLWNLDLEINYILPNHVFYHLDFRAPKTRCGSSLSQLTISSHSVRTDRALQIPLLTAETPIIYDYTRHNSWPSPQY